MAVVAAAPAPESLAKPRAARAPFHIPSLDGLRAISFLVVFAAHAGVELVPGGFGVTVFFFLSGYLITTLLRLEGQKTGRYNLKHFYLRRALRILPPFYLVLVTAIALGEGGYLRTAQPLEPAAITTQLFHMSNYWFAFHGWSGVPLGTGVYWSLAVEEHFYLLFPAVFILLTRKRFSGKQQAFVFWGACAAVLVWRCLLVFLWHTPADRTYLCSDTRIDSILFGCALAVWNNPMLDPPAGSPLESSVVGVKVSAIALAILLVTFVVRGEAFRESVRYTLQGIALTPLFIAAIRWPRWPIFAPLNWPAARFVGTLSYSLYLVHQGVLYALEQHTRLSRFPRAGVALVLSVAIAWGIYECIEKPCARLRRRLSQTG